MVSWIISSKPVGYADAIGAMERRVERISATGGGEAVWLLEHPPMYTAGTSAKPSDLADKPRFPVHKSKRGGQFTYHGPGQRVAYLMLDLNSRGRDVRSFVRAIEAWIVRSLADLGVEGFARDGLTGVWVAGASRRRGCGGQPMKIAAVGLRLRRWVSFHGVSVNVSTDLGHYADIVPCGIEDCGVTSLEDLRAAATMADLDEALITNFDAAFRPAR